MRVTLTFGNSPTGPVTAQVLDILGRGLVPLFKELPRAADSGFLIAVGSRLGDDLVLEGRRTGLIGQS